MARPKGIDHFLDYLKGLESEYAVIGGGAAAILMDDNGLSFRATKDVDLVLLTNSSKELNTRISAYVESGKYEIREATENSPRYYRFRKPQDNAFPEMIEIFARNEQKIELTSGQYIIPVQSDEIARISAILLDDQYFAIIKSTVTATASGASVVNFLGNICLKARAHRELSDRKSTGDASVDTKDIAKHRNDILRMAPNLKGTEKLLLTAAPKADLEFAIEQLRGMPANQFKSIMTSFPGVKLTDLIQMLEKVFLGA